MVAVARDKINFHKVSKYANVLIFKEFYPKTKNVSYYLKAVLVLVFFFSNFFVILQHVVFYHNTPCLLDPFLP